MKTYLVPLAALALLGGCAPMSDLLETGRPYAARTAVELLKAACALPVEERKKNHAAILERLESDAYPGRAAPFDCDGVGGPDF